MPFQLQNYVYEHPCTAQYLKTERNAKTLSEMLGGFVHRVEEVKMLSPHTFSCAHTVFFTPERNSQSPKLAIFVQISMEGDYP